MKYVIALVVMLFASSVRADTPQYQIHWRFIETTSNGIEDYSTNLGIPLAATLPIEAVKANWSCVREVPHDLGPEIIGKFGCTDTHGNYTSAFAHCSKTKIDANSGTLVFKLPGVCDSVVFNVSCTTLPQ